jgi:hypothetical protein
MLRPLLFAGLWLVAFAACFTLAWTLGEALAGPAGELPGAGLDTVALGSPAGVLVRY